MTRNDVIDAVKMVVSLCIFGSLAPHSVLSQTAGNPQEAAPRGELVAVSIPAPSLLDNAFAIPAEQSVSIYLPPTYGTSSERYPVVYFLPGFADLVHYYTIWGVYGFSLGPSMDQLIAAGTIREMIVVIPNGSDFLQGSFYVNSPLLGNWEDFIVRDVVSYVDKHYRTIANAASRGISGHSMGGSGALFISMRHPDVFGAAYALSPGLAAPDGLKQHGMFTDPSVMTRTLTVMDSLAHLPSAEAKVVLMSAVNNMLNAADLSAVFSIAYGMTFAPRGDGTPPFFDYPFSMVDGTPILDAGTWARWESGFGDLAGKVNEYRNSSPKLSTLVVDVGVRDEHVWIPQGCRAFTSLLNDGGLSCRLVEFEGSHQDQLKLRLEEHMLPEMSRVLQRDR